MPPLARPRASRPATTKGAQVLAPNGIRNGRRPLSRTNSGIDLTFTLKNAFGKESFRGCQRQVIEAALEDNDVFVLAPTGMGKSLCYQLPAMAVQHGLTLVISPLLALMQNQVSYLQSLKLPAATLNSSIDSKERERIYEDLNCGHPRTRLLYITPESASRGNFRKTLQKINRNGELSRFVIDEGHCISEWGHDFRKDYRSLSYFRLDFPNVPIMVLTATATEKVRADVLKLLHLSPPRLKTFVMSFNRPNLHYEIRYKSANEDAYPAMLKMIRDFNSNRRSRLTRVQNCTPPPPNYASARYAPPVQRLMVVETARPVCGIIYAPRKVQCDNIAARLNSDGVMAASYHADLGIKDRERILNAWVDGEKLGVVVATLAFGMGVDRADVRFVFHYELPKSIEAYYQESGRAGRDGFTARCILFYSREDVERRRYLIGQEEARKDAKGIRASQRPAGMNAFEKMVEYCESATICRHKSLCEYFGDTIGDATQKIGGINTFCDYACDICRDPEGTKQQKIAKLTPVGSQNEFYPREEIERELEVFDTRFDQVPVSVEETDHEDEMVLDADEEVMAIDTAHVPIVNTTNHRFSITDDAQQTPRPQEKPFKKSTTIQRDETVKQILELLDPLNAQSPPPDLLPRAAKRMEHKIFDRSSQQRSVNALGRSSTLLTAGKQSNLCAKYTKEKDKVLRKVKEYVKTATSEDVDMENIQQGEIWDVFKEVLDNQDMDSGER